MKEAYASSPGAAVGLLDGFVEQEENLCLARKRNRCGHSPHPQ